MDLQPQILKRRTAPSRPVSDPRGARGVDLPSVLSTPLGHSTAERKNSAAEDGHQPVRTCVGCRERVTKTDLVRLVAIDGSLVIDRESTLPGRGAYVHSRSDCVDSALRRRAFPRALRVQGTLDADTVSDSFAAGFSLAADSSGAVG